MNGICHDTHMEDGDVQLSTLAQQPESQNVSVRHCRRANLFPLAIVKSATPSSASVTVSAGLLQIWHRQDPADFECMYSLDFKVEYEYYPHSLLASDGLAVAIVPQSSSFK